MGKLGNHVNFANDVSGSTTHCILADNKEWQEKDGEGGMKATKKYKAVLAKRNEKDDAAAGK